jgi:hypothetical protein
LIAEEADIDNDGIVNSRLTYEWIKIPNCRKK